MATSLRRWFLFAWPCAGAILAWVACQAIIRQYESVWQMNQNQVVLEELEFFHRFVDSGKLSPSEVAQLTEETTGGQLMFFPDDAGTMDRSLVQRPSMEWFDEPDGFRRVRAVRSVELGKDALHWLVFTRRIPPVNRNVYGWSYWLIPLGLLAGGGISWVQLRKRLQRERMLRSLQGLSNASRTLTPREAMVEMLPRKAFGPEIHRELIALVERFQKTYSDIQIDAEQSQSVLAAMPVGILALTSDLRLSFANRAGIEMLDLSEPVPVNARLIELTRQPKVIDVVSEAQHSNQTLDSEIERNEGNAVLRLRAYPLATDAGSVTKPAMLLILTDETRLRKLENARRDFTANVSHELKTPLAAIKAYTETLLMGAMDDPDAKERFVQRINEQAMRLDNLIQDLLRLTKIQSLPDRIHLSRVPVAELVHTSVDEQAPIAATRQVQVINQVTDDSLVVMAEDDALRTILSNLLSNAIRYSQQGGRVEIQAERASGHILISVIDNGIGIPESDLERIFERFYRVDKARSADSGGTGLGLAIVKYLVQALGGSIRVRSRLGEGSEFTVRLSEASETA
ncbi:MAG: sensor histidine kinase [Planctomycetota bacterium]|jgi:two-component system phosphate regulon sensor histidine kinase PhoR